jgi:hypothetical protein
LNYDSTNDTQDHIAQVRRFINVAVMDLISRAANHDQSKLEEPEKPLFDVLTPRLKKLTYGSDEYKASLDELKVALSHHYENNDHHPEFWGEKGIKGMNLISLLELLCDWKAATLRHADGDIRRSIEINQQRFGYSDELKGILLNTLAIISPEDATKP